MPRYLRKFHVWENCFYSTYGRNRALRYGEKTYCLCGEQYFVKNNKRVPGSMKCNDWPKCKGLLEVKGFYRNKRVMG